MDSNVLRRVKRRDRIARWVISAGGMTVIGSVIFILFLIVRVAVHLFQAPRAEVFSRFALPPEVPAAEVLATGLDEYLESAFTLSRDGSFTFFEARRGTLLDRLAAAPPAPQAQVAAVEYDGGHIYELLWSDGSLSLEEVRFQPQFDAEGRRTIVFRHEQVALFPPPAPGVPVRSLARLGDDGRLTRVSLFADDRLLVEQTEVSEVTGAPEILDGRVKTLHPRIHGGILARDERDDAELSAGGIERFHVVVCNLYPFRETVADPLATEEEIIEKIDIGGPAMVRAAAKNHHHVTVVISPDQYEEVAAAVEAGGPDLEMRRRLAAEAFFRTASYDAAIVGWLSQDRLLPLRRVGQLRYGENPHQSAALFVEDGASPWWSRATLHQGKEMSFNNFADAEAAWRLASDLGPGSAVVVKHTNACGAARAETMHAAFEAAWEGDAQASFGGVVALNGRLDRETAQSLAGRFVEVVVASSLDTDALSALGERSGLRVLTAPPPSRSGEDYRRIDGGFLLQHQDQVGSAGWQVASERDPTADEMDSLRFAWVVAAHTKSNAIVVARGVQAVGIGAGDQSRVGAAQRAVAKAGDRAKGAVAASDAFFPFRDGLDTLTEAGVTAVVEPGGSRNDQEVIDAANEAGAALIFTGTRHFRH